MKNQPNKIVTLEWLLPLFDQQLSEISISWQENTVPNFAQIPQSYHQMSDALVIANLPKLGYLASKLGQLAASVANNTFDTSQWQMGQFAHQLLHYELIQYIQTGTYRSVLLDRVINALEQILSQMSQRTDMINTSQITLVDSARTDNDYLATVRDIEIPIPSYSSIHSPRVSLHNKQYQQLLLVWRQQVQQLLAANTNQPSILLRLEKVSRYLWQTTNALTQQRLWYLTGLWLTNLASNQLPLPTHYVQLLSHLEQVIEARCQQIKVIASKSASDADSLTHQSYHSINAINKSFSKYLADDFIESLIADLYIQVNILTSINAHTKAILGSLSADIVAPDTITDSYVPSNAITTDVVRYEDSDEIAIDTHQLISNRVSDDVDSTNGSADDNTDDSVIFTKVIDDNFNLVNDIAADNDTLQVAHMQVPADNFETDEEIREIFIEEALEVLDDLNDFVPIWQQDTQDLSPLIEVRRGFHTLKGSGRMVGAFSIGEVAWAVEKLLNNILDNTLSVTDDVVTLVLQTTERLPVLITDFAARQVPSIDTAFTVLQSKNILAGRSLLHGLDSNMVDIEAISATDSIIRIDSPKVASLQKESMQQDTQQNYTIEDSKLNIPTEIAPFLQEAELMLADTYDADPAIKDIFIEEAEEVLAQITPLYEQWCKEPTNFSVLTEVRRGFHTLKGSGRMVGANYSAELAWSIESMLNRILDHSITPSIDTNQLINDVLIAYPKLVSIFAQGHNSHQDYPAIVPIWVACANAYSKQYGDKFSYAVLRVTWLKSEQKDVSTLSHDDENADNILQTINYVNEIMAEATTVAISQSKEEQVFCKIFIEEANELLQDIDDFIYTHQDQPYIEVSDEILRAFHTLRAASGSTALTAISSVSAIIEHSLEQLQLHDTPMNPQHLQALMQSATLIKGYLSTYEQNIQQQDLFLEDNQSQQDLTSLQALLSNLQDRSIVNVSTLSIEQLLDTNIDTLLDAEWQLTAALDNSNLQQVQAYIHQLRQQIERLAVETAESPKFTVILNALNIAYCHLYDHPQIANNKKIQAALLMGHAQLVGLFDALAGSMSLKIDQQVIESLQAISKNYSDSIINITKHNEIDNNHLDSDKSITVGKSEPVPTVKNTYEAELEYDEFSVDVELLEIFLEEAQELDESIAQIFSTWRINIANINALTLLQRHLHTLKGGARMVGIRSIGDLTHAAENIYEAFLEFKIVPTSQWLSIMQVVQDTLSLQITHTLRHQQSFFANKLVEQLQQFVQQPLPETVSLILPALPIYDESQTQSLVDNAVNKELSVEHSSVSDAIDINKLIAQSWPNGLPDLNILDVYLEEADELIVSSNKYLQLFLNSNSISSLQSLQRDMHTLKGGARMVTAGGIANLMHEMETVYEDLASRRRPATKMVSQLLSVCHDWIVDAIFILNQHVNPPSPVTLIAALQQFSHNPDSLKQVPNESLQAQRSIIVAAKNKQEAEQGVKDISKMPSMTGSFAEQEQNVSSNEMIRVSGGLIEHMINLSGESAINRARIDMGMSSLTHSIEEMGTTVQRLADQLRRMETELEAQILSQIDEELIDTEDFDPLEMDQYSSLNQLSKSLSESASDLVDINNTLLEKTRDNESLLMQLSRTQTELQDGLMNSRMVPFTRLKPRLERVVRQTANELEKVVTFTIIDADDEMDRTILDRITSPLEHMLRNAVDHGIEDVQTRLQAGKDRNGLITLEVLREGSEVVIHLTDDGRGIDVDAVRNKAIAKGLIDANDDSLTDIDIMQYIFNAGLTTTKQVTQISGRGVGMDVVISEVRQLGGVVSVTSDSGKGSRFTMRVPLTVAVTDALVVRAADRYYTIPLVQIERVVRINPEKLYEYYQSDDATLNVEDDNYRIRYLNEILFGSQLNELMVDTNTSLPLIIIKNRTGQKIALQVDQIVGSRIEVVVKPLGRQLSRLAGISAATITGDGSVMLILDLIALMRNAPTLKNVMQVDKLESQVIEAQPTVMVIDDSVTVRKVTSRFLERQGINVIIAKDGVDATEILQETIPDLILLDIEMPRMDGFEVAAQIRYSKRLKHIPIIMITSRTGEKHRERALDIGVNDYMGKPFQENELLNKVQNLLSKKLDLSSIS